MYCEIVNNLTGAETAVVVEGCLLSPPLVIDAKREERRGEVAVFMVLDLRLDLSKGCSVRQTVALLSLYVLDGHYLNVIMITRVFVCIK